MANTYNLNILKLEVKVLENELQDVVYIAYFKYTATSDDEMYTESCSGVAQIPAPDPNNFIPFEDLTEQDVKNWVYEIVNFENFKESLDGIISNKQHPTTEIKDVPW